MVEILIILFLQDFPFDPCASSNRPILKESISFRAHGVLPETEKTRFLACRRPSLWFWPALMTTQEVDVSSGSCDDGDAAGGESGDSW